MACISADAVTTGTVNESAKRYALLVKVLVNNIRLILIQLYFYLSVATAGSLIR